MTEVIALIPARSGSKGVPDKNVRPLGGHPLIAWTVRTCLQAASIDRVIVSTDSERYAEIARRYGAEVPFIRPKEISQDESSDIEFILHAISWLETNKECPEYIAHMRPTTPLRDPSVIDIGVLQFIEHRSASSLRSVHEMSETAFKKCIIDKNGYLAPLIQSIGTMEDINQPRQMFPVTFEANGYIDVLSVKSIMKNQVIHGSKVIPFITPNIGEIDTPSDLEYLEQYISQYPNTVDRIFQDILSID